MGGRRVWRPVRVVVRGFGGGGGDDDDDVGGGGGGREESVGAAGWDSGIAGDGDGGGGLREFDGAGGGWAEAALSMLGMSRLRR